MLTPSTIRCTLSRVYQISARSVHSRNSLNTSHDLKYADKLKQKAREKGLELDKLKSQAREEARCQQQKEAVALLASFRKTEIVHLHTSSRSEVTQGAKLSNTRRDSSPVKPLSSILNLSKLLTTPHTSSQISALWIAYHASQTQGTGRGYICASLPSESYNAMARVAKQYPVFVVPVPRENTPDPSAGETDSTAHEFFFLQWDFHPASPVPSTPDANPFEPITLAASSDIPEPSTVLFTPLQEYKLRASFATPHLVLTFYTDLSQSHGVVLLRGEITPSSTSAAVQSGQETPGRFLLNQVDAQLLAMGLQRFYLWGDGTKDSKCDISTEALLKQFHEEPERFDWRDLIKASNVVA